MIDASSSASVREDRRADYLFDTRSAAEAVGCHPNKFGDWLYRTRRKFKALYRTQPGPTTAELMGIIASAESEKKARPRD